MNTAWMCSSPLTAPLVLHHHSGKKRVWVPDEQEAYVEAEVKSEAAGGKVNVETKDQKVRLPVSRDSPQGLGLLLGQQGVRGVHVWRECTSPVEITTSRHGLGGWRAGADGA